MGKIHSLTKVEFIMTPDATIKLDAIQSITKKDNFEKLEYYLIINSSDDDRFVIKYEDPHDREQDYCYIISLWFTVNGGLSPLAF